MTEDIQRIKISLLPVATTLAGLYTIGVSAQGRTVGVPMSILKGDKGDRFVYSDFTPAQLEQLKLRFSDLNEADKLELKGKDALQPLLTATLDARGHLIIEVEYVTK